MALFIQEGGTGHLEMFVEMRLEKFQGYRCVRKTSVAAWAGTGIRRCSMEQLIAFFPDALLGCELEEVSKLSIRADDGILVVPDKDHVADGVERGIPFVGAAFHGCLGGSSAGNVFDDEGDAWFTIIKGGGNVLDKKI